MRESSIYRYEDSVHLTIKYEITAMTCQAILQEVQ